MVGLMDFLKSHKYKCEDCVPGLTDCTHCCKTCQKNVCTSCHERYHDNHHVDPIKMDDTADIMATLTLTQTSTVCCNHDNKGLEYCMDCEKEVCKLCKMNSHKGHEITTMKYACKTKRTLMNDLALKVENKTFKESSVKCTLFKDRMKSSTEVLLEKLPEYFAELKKMLDKRPEEHVNEITKLTTELLNEIDELQKQLEGNARIVLQKAKTLQDNSKTIDTARPQEYQDVIKALTSVLDQASMQLPQYSICYTQACTVEGFQNLVSGLGRVEKRIINTDGRSIYYYFSYL